MKEILFMYLYLWIFFSIIPVRESALFHTVWDKLFWKRQYVSSFDGADVLPQSDLTLQNRSVWIITTASIPWMTGTSVNPLLRAVYLSRKFPEAKINLLLPWLTASDQQAAFSFAIKFKRPEDQEAYIRNWLKNECHQSELGERVNITFYPANYHKEFHSIFPIGDITALIPDETADFCILEEPEHLNWFKAPFVTKSWMDKFNYVLGIIHTNYVMYTKSESMGKLKAPLIYAINQGMCRAYCHKIIKLSSTLQEFAKEKEIVCNVHGVREKYLTIGDLTQNFRKGAYFVGKLAWQKGLGELMTLLEFTQRRFGNIPQIDIFGSGPHMDEIKSHYSQKKFKTTFYAPKDHSRLSEYKVFVNPSLSEVLCTTIAEALAMGKWVVCPNHPSNDFFRIFPNCLLYNNEEEFAANLFWALHHDPKPLSKELRYLLSWEAATERLINSSITTKEMFVKTKELRDKFLAWVLEEIRKIKFENLDSPFGFLS